MSLPHLLLVDDSDAILAYERAALLGHYDTTFARNGEEALEILRDFRPAAILLDLSMPRMDGEGVLAELQASATLSRVPVVVVSSERARGEACLARGAAAYVPKPIRADELRSTIARVLAEERSRTLHGSLAVLALDVGGTLLALPLTAVRGAFHLPETTPLLGGPPFLCESFELRGRPVAVLNLARRLGLRHQTSLLDRKVVVLDIGEAVLGLTADQVFDPEEIPRADLLPRSAIGIGDHPPVAELLEAVVRTARATLPLIRPEALLSARLLTRLTHMLHRAHAVSLAAGAARDALAAPAESA